MTALAVAFVLAMLEIALVLVAAYRRRPPAPPRWWAPLHDPPQHVRKVER